MPRTFKPLSVILLIATVLLPSTALASQVAIGVKKGDWVEYQVKVNGNMPDHDAQWARTDVVDAQGLALFLNMTTQFVNGTYIYENITLNLGTGQLGDDFFIPANLSPGESFYDAHIGNITITGIEQRTYANTQRTVVTGSTNVTDFFWDQQAGVLVEAYSNYSNINFTMHTVADNTNMWQPQLPQLSLTLTATILAAIVLVAVFVLVLLWLGNRGQKRMA